MIKIDTWNFLSNPETLPIIFLVVIGFSITLAYKIIKISKNPYLLKPTPQLYLGYGLFFASYAITRILFLFTDYLEVSKNTHNNVYIWLMKSAFIISLIGFTNLIYSLEIFYYKKKLILSKLLLFLILITIFFSYEIYRIVAYILLFICWFSILNFYYKIYKISRGDIKIKIKLTIKYLIRFYIAVVLDSTLTREITTRMDLSWISYIIPPFLFIHVLNGLSKSIPFQDPSKWLYHLWISEKISGDCLFEIGFKEIDHDKELIRGLLRSFDLMEDEFVNKEIRGLIFLSFKVIILI